MGRRKSEGRTSISRRFTSCRYYPYEKYFSDDVELKQLFNDLALTLFRVMEHHDADILARYELRGQSLSEIANDIACSRADATHRLNHAQRCFCELAVLTLMPRNLE